MLGTRGMSGDNEDAKACQPLSRPSLRTIERPTLGLELSPAH